MKGFIYIAGSCCNPYLVQPGQDGTRLDNDPHFWNAPPTWGICRNDLRRNADVGDYVFFVLSKRSNLPQMVFAYLKVAEKISHMDAYHRLDLLGKRMFGGNPDGNIIVDENGNYNNRFDGGVHLRIFDKVKRHYVIGCAQSSRRLLAEEIGALAPTFVQTLTSVTEKLGQRPIDLITQKGFELSGTQVNQLLAWLND
jgi:hypothetical protein